MRTGRDIYGLNLGLLVKFRWCTKAGKVQGEHLPEGESCGSIRYTDATRGIPWTMGSATAGLM
jgi:hypothetical protein